MAEFEGEQSNGGKKKGTVFGLPIWMVGIILAGGAVLFYIIRKQRGSAATDTSAVPVDSSLVTTEDQQPYGLPGGAIGTYLNNDPTNPAYPVGLTPVGVPGPVTNQQWARLAADNLIAKGDDPSLVANALSKFLQGASLDAAEQAVINLALQSMGQPPEGVIPVLTAPGTAPSPTPVPGSDNGNPAPQPSPSPAPPATRRYVTVAKYTSNSPPWNSTLSGIAAHYGTTVANLAAINHIANPNLIITGQKIYIDP